MRSIVALMWMATAGAGMAAGACAPPEPVVWDEIHYPTTQSAVPAEVETPVSVIPAGVCPGSFRTSAVGADTYAAWWTVRPDSSVILMAARSSDGGTTWDAPVPADTLDKSRHGCTRPAPSVYADRNGYVHFAYFLDSREGPGVFFTHTMNGRVLGVGDGVFHAPVPIVYGEKPSVASVIASGDTVVVAYEDPNSERAQVSVALSRTTGHIFETRVLVSSPSLSSVAPRVAFRRDSVIVAWTEIAGLAPGDLGTRSIGARAKSGQVPHGGRIAVRAGMWR